MGVQYYSSLQQGAPSLTGVAGNLITLFDAVLVNGYGQVNVSTITRTGVTATVTTATEHGLETGDTATIGGATQGDYNGDFVVTVTDPTTLTYTVANSPATPATGTITCRRAAAGFTKPFSGTNAAVYRSIDPAGNRYFYQILDDAAGTAGAREARLRGFETMTDVNTGLRAFPTTGQLSAGFHIHKSNTLDAVARPWILVSDGRLVYFFSYPADTVLSTLSGGQNASAVFGDLESYRVGDTFCAVTTGASQANNFTGSTQYFGAFNTTTNISSVGLSQTSAVYAFARPYTGVQATSVGQPYATGLNGQCMGQTAHISYPALVDNGLYITPTVIVQSSPSIIRSTLPGVYEPIQGLCLPNNTIIENVQGFVGRKFAAVHVKNQNSFGMAFIDLTGPWR